jgi:4'-phosphopantetheinyl transferase
MASAPLLWLVDASALGDAALAPLTGWLGPSERRRFDGFTRPLRRRQFLVGRVLLRQALGALLGIPARDIGLLERRGNAPLLDRPDCAHIGFSISHSGPWVACAVSDECLLGLDIEVLDPTRDLHALAAQAFEPADIAWLRARPESSRVRDFYDMWCVKEARIKLPAGQGACVRVEHHALSIAICSAQVLSHPPLLEVRSI